MILARFYDGIPPTTKGERTRSAWFLWVGVHDTCNEGYLQEGITRLRRWDLPDHMKSSELLYRFVAERSAEHGGKLLRRRKELTHVVGSCCGVSRGGGTVLF